MKAIQSKAFLALVGLLLTSCTNVFLFPSRILLRTPRELGLDYREVMLKATDGSTLHGWHLPAVGEKLGVVTFFHGNAENISTHIGAVTWLPRLGYDVVAFDYRGYGISEGHADIGNAVQDSQTILTWVADTFPAPRYVLGQSLGGAVALAALGRSERRENFSGAVIDSAFSSYRKIAREKLGQLWITWPLQAPLSYLFSETYSAEKYVETLSPLALLFLHGSADEIVNESHSRHLFELARGPKDLVITKGAPHIAALSSLEVQHRVAEFFAAHKRDE